MGHGIPHLGAKCWRITSQTTDFIMPTPCNLILVTGLLRPLICFENLWVLVSQAAKVSRLLQKVTDVSQWCQGRIHPSNSTRMRKTWVGWGVSGPWSCPGILALQPLFIHLAIQTWGIVIEQIQHPAIPKCNQYQYIKALIWLCESWLQQHVDVNTYKYSISWSCIWYTYLYQIYIIYLYITIIHLVLSPDNVLKHPRVHVKWANPSYINTWSHEHAHTHKWTNIRQSVWSDQSSTLQMGKRLRNILSYTTHEHKWPKQWVVMYLQSNSSTLM